MTKSVPSNEIQCSMTNVGAQWLITMMLNDQTEESVLSDPKTSLPNHHGKRKWNLYDKKQETGIDWSKS